MLARLASVPIVYVRLGGRRDDAPHVEAFNAAISIVAPFASPLDDPAMLGWVSDKTTYISGLSPRPPSVTVATDTVLVVLGGGGSSTDAAFWGRAARVVPDRKWVVIGPCEQATDLPINLLILGWVGDAAAWIARAGVVIGGAGNGVIGIVLAARRPFVCVPEDRPFGEQHSNARGLAAAGAAVVCEDAAAADWPMLIAAAERLNPAAAAALDTPDGAARAMAHLIALADRE
ncbi:glycosyltransferase [Sphingomonas radiodurans]|uniref:glycosyltransferase n=1 Tax=Sphingomonas radiodurans TaxID=2890321 RepID=UPI001E38842E|nr:glycosyltransferase [Sphingomonas radiodurans]WBH15837.1 glycosyltransferase [Sphingomonas radiodurans]